MCLPVAGRIVIKRCFWAAGGILLLWLILLWLSPLTVLYLLGAMALVIIVTGVYLVYLVATQERSTLVKWKGEQTCCTYRSRKGKDL